jgi:hypothetical protein
MDGTQALVGLAGIGLVAVNAWTGPDKAYLSSMLFTNTETTDPTLEAKNHAALVKIGGELLFVVVATVVAGVSGTWSTTVLVALVALWALWLINRKGGGVQATAPVTSGGG